MTLNAGQVRAAARPPARDGRARRPAFRFRQGGSARDGEHDRTDVTQRASRLPGDPRCPRRGPHPGDHPPCRGTNDAEHKKPGARLPAHDDPRQLTPAQQNRNRRATGIRPARRNHARRQGRPAHRDGNPQHSHPPGRRSGATSASPSRTSPSMTPPSSSPPSCRTAVARARTGATSSRAGCASNTPTTRKSSPPARFTTSRQVTSRSWRSRSRSSSSAPSPTMRRRPRP